MSGHARVLHVAQPTDAGVARCVVDLAVAQRAQGVDAVVACPGDGPLPGWLAAAGVPTSRWEARRSPGPHIADEVRRLRALVGAHDPDVVHLHSAKAGLAGRLAVRGSRPTVFQPHAWSFEAARGPVRVGAVAWERYAARWTDLLVCVSEAERICGEHVGVRARRTAVVPNGIDVVALRAADADERRRARHTLDLDPTAPTGVLVGRLAPQKGQDLAVAAWPLIRAAVPAAVLLLVGDGPSRAVLTAAAGHGVRLVGRRDDVADWYAAADVVLVPSRWEGMALTPLEAMARSRSVVATDVAGIRESVPADAGAIVAAESSSALAAAVLARLSGAVDADAEGRRGRLHVERSHDLRRTTAAVTAAYDRVGAEPKR